MIPTKGKFFKIVYLDNPTYNYVGFARFTGRVINADPLDESDDVMYEFDSLDGAFGFTDKGFFSEAHIVADADVVDSVEEFDI